MILQPSGIAPWLFVLCSILAFAALASRGIRRSFLRRSTGSRFDAGASFFEQIRDAALVTGNGFVTEANAAAASQFGYSRDEIIGLPITKLLADPRDEGRFVRALMQGPVTDYALPLRTSDGRRLDCLITAEARFNAEGRVVGCRGLARDMTECNRVMADLRRAEQDYRGLFEAARDAILILDPADERVLDANEQAFSLYGCAREELIGSSMVDRSVDPSRGEALIHATRAASGRFELFESRQIRRDGTIIDIEINAAEVYYKDRHVILSINRDISARRAAEHAIRTSEERFRLLLESVTDYAIVMLDPEGRVVSWNEGAQRITGYAESEILGESAAIFLPPEERDSLIDHLHLAAVADRVGRDMTRVRKDGSRFAASVTLTKIVDEGGALRGFAEITHDITERVQLERARQDILAVLRDVASEWTETFDAVQVPIVLLDRDGAIRRLNRAAQSLTGHEFAQLIGMKAAHLPGEPWSTIARVARRAFEEGEAETARAVEGDSVWQVSTSLGAFQHGHRRAIVVAYDLTLVTQLEASLRRNEVSAALGALVAGVAHEVRNPLFTLSATLEAWEVRYGGTEGVVRYAGALREQVDRLHRLMQDLLDYGKPHPLAFSEGSLADVLNRAVSSCAAVAEQHGARILRAAGEVPRMAIDAARLEQVFQNVIDNAIRYSAGGVVRVETQVHEDSVVCRVIDEGPGVDTGDAENAFRPFYTRRHGGTGLGLAIARKIVIAHGGAISLTNRDDRQGAVATIRLPVRVPQSDRMNMAVMAE